MNYDKTMGMSNRDIHIKQNSGGYELPIKGLREMVANAIAEAFHYMHIIEAWGTGIPQIINRCKGYGLKERVFEEFGDGFWVTIFRKITSGDGKKDITSQNVASKFEKYLSLLKKANITKKYIANIQDVFIQCKSDEPFGQKNVKEWLNCFVSTATNIM